MAERFANMGLNKFLTRGKLIFFCFFLLLSISFFLESCSHKKEDVQSFEATINSDLLKGEALLIDHPDSALFYAQRAFHGAKKNQLQSLALAALSLEGNALLALNQNKEALACFKKLLAMPLIEKKVALKAEVYKNSGTSQARLKNYLSALINFRKALNYAGQIDAPAIFADAAESMGDLYAAMNYPNNALKYYGKAQEFRNQDANEKGYYLLQIKIGNVFLAKSQQDTALEAYRQALIYFTATKNSTQEALAACKIAEVQLFNGNIPLVLQSGQRAKELALKADNLDILMQSYWVLGKGYFAQEDYPQARENLSESLKIADILNKKDLKIALYQKLALVNEKLTDSEQALAYYKKYNETVNEVLKEHQEQKSEDILTAIKLDKREREIASLSKKNAIVEKYSSIRSEGLGNNRNFIILLTAFVVVFVLLVAVYYKRFKDKKRISLLLENRVKERTAELHHTLQKLFFHINNTSLAVVELNPDLQIIGWSGQSEKIFGWTSKAVLGQAFFKVDLFDNEVLKEIKEIFNKIFKGKLSKKFILTKNHHKDGHQLFIEWNFSVLYNEAGQITSISCFANNVTNREKALLDAETANKELDNFIYKTSHDVKGPISRIEGLINLGIMEAQEEVSKQYFVMLQQVATNFNIVLSRLFRIHGIYYHEPVSVSLNLKSEIASLLQKLQKKNALYELKYEIDIPDEVHWNTDKLLFYIIIQNIYENALDYRRDGLSVIIFTVETTNPKYLKLQIRDNGTCIPLQAADRIFDMFFQNTAESNTAGLGLYMVKKSVEKLGGTIKLLEEYEETFFEILLPAR